MKKTSPTIPFTDEMLQQKMQASWKQLYAAFGPLALNPPDDSDSAKAALRQLRAIIHRAQAALLLVGEKELRTRLPSILELARMALTEFRSGNIAAAVDIRNAVAGAKSYRKSTTTKQIIAQLDYARAVALVADAQLAAYNGNRAKVVDLLLEALGLSEDIGERADYLALTGLLITDQETREKLSTVSSAITEGCWDDAVEALRLATVVLNGNTEPLLRNIVVELASVRATFLGELNTFARAALDAQNFAGARRYHGLMEDVDGDNPLTLQLSDDITAATANSIVAGTVV